VGRNPRVLDDPRCRIFRRWTRAFLERFFRGATGRTIRSSVASRPRRFSVFSQPVDAAAFIAYFLGAVVPLLALGFVVQRWALPALHEESLWQEGLVALVLSIGLLSGAAFLLLRRITRQTVARMRADNERLSALLETAGGLARIAHEAEVGATTVACALRMVGARAAFLVEIGADGAPKAIAAGGQTDLFERLSGPLRELVPLACSGSRPALGGGGGSDQAAAPIAAIPVEGLGALVVVADAARLLTPGDVDSISTLAVLASVAARRAHLADAQRNFFVHVTDLLVAALDAHLDEQSGHSRRVAELANRIGREMGLAEAVRQRLHFAALLHDVGMLRIHPQRFADPKANRQHPTLGQRMLAPIQLWADVAPLVLHHHEWFDGNGYPDGLAGEAIPMESRIIGLAEAFDSMTSASSYKAPLERDEALRRVEAGAGTQFDPTVVQTFLALVAREEV
jgi:HD-GYP domain-containing protein (c-di-GMP phosphodiesterase class II)